MCAWPCAQGARRQALVGALRREDSAVKEAKRLEGELEGMRGLLKVPVGAGAGWDSRPGRLLVPSRP